MKHKTEHIKASTVEQAWEKANEIFPTDYDKDEAASQRTGYPIYRSRIEYHNYICDLGCRLEVNLVSGRTVHIWIEDPVQKAREELAEITRKLYPM